MIVCSFVTFGCELDTDAKRYPGAIIVGDALLTCFLKDCSLSVVTTVLQILQQLKELLSQAGVCSLPLFVHNILENTTSKE